MSTYRWLGLATVGAWVAVAGPLGAQDLTADDIVERSQEAFLAPGDDMSARVTMKLINKAGKERVREMTMLRKDLEGGDQK